MLWRDLKAWQIYGANTEVGKTVVSTILCRALLRRAPNAGVAYLKPVSTGPLHEADDRHLTKHAPGIISKCLSQFSIPVSPHLAAQLDSVNSKVLKDDKAIVSQTKRELNRQLSKGVRYALLETAGGVLSPGPSGTVQADLYRPLRLPSLLVGDSKLGGIGTTISAFESLHVRGYDVDSVIVFDDPAWGNAGYLDQYFAAKHGIETTALPPPPPRRADAQSDAEALDDYYEACATSPAIGSLVDRLNSRHFSRVSKLSSLPSLAESVIWHPFRQHGIPHNIIAIDSAYDDHFEAYNQESDSISTTPHDTGLAAISPPSSHPLTTPLFDASASWWTQGLGHGNAELSLAAAYASGRYGHVMFAHAVHEPALDLCYGLLSTLGNPRLARVFFSDNGSTGMEVAVKMALRAACQRYGWRKEDGGGGGGGGGDDAQSPVGVLGLRGSYHGDTIGVMNCSEPSVYNERVDWYKPWGFWFDPPQVLLQDGRWTITIPDSFFDSSSAPADTDRTLTFPSLASIFDYASRAPGQAAFYKAYITSTLRRLVGEQGRRFGALILEPVVMGAGGMIFVDPLFQRTLVTTVRENPGLIAPATSPPPDSDDQWSGLPFIADEVFTGLYRLGRASSSAFLSTTTTGAEDVALAPDIAVHAKLLTGGLVPLAVTAASRPIFDAFVSPRKTDALLHGHSYTAHPVGCAVANKSLALAADVATSPSWQAYQDAWTNARLEPNARRDEGTPFAFFSPAFVDALSRHPLIHGCWALGSVLALTLRTPGHAQAGYASNVTAGLQARLLTTLDAQGRGIHSRVLGNVLYLMCSLVTQPGEVVSLEKQLIEALNQELADQ